MNKIIGIIVLSITLMACGSGKRQQQDLVILDSVSSEKLRIAFITDTAINNQPKWIPTYNQLEIIDTIIAKAIKNDDTNHYEILCANSIKSYYRQYICSIDSNGDSLVYINAMYYILEYPAEDENGEVTIKRSDWQHKLILVNDGGEYFWHIKINFTRKTYDAFTVNGVG